MSLIKAFGDFLFEGRYDSLTGKISAAVMRKIKETDNGEEYFDGVKVIYGPEDSVPGFIYLIEKGMHINVDYFVDEVSGIDVEVVISIIRDEAPVFERDFILDGETDDQSSVIYIFVQLTPGSEPRVYPEIAVDLRNLVRHEIEHLTQRGWGEIEGKKMRRNEGVRKRINSNPELYHRYYTLKDEIPANIQGLYSEAKTRKLPFKEVVHNYLDKKIEQGVIPSTEKTRIYRLWRAAAQKIGGLPPL
jgi:hypothetical protein